MYPVDEIARLFPTIVAAPELPNVDDYNMRRDDDDDDGYLQPRRRGMGHPIDARKAKKEIDDGKKMEKQPSRKAAR